MKTKKVNQIVMFLLKVIPILLLSIATMAQTDSIYINKYINSNSNEVEYFTSKPLILVNKYTKKIDGKLVIGIRPELKFGFVTGFFYNSVDNHEYDVLKIIFKNGDEITSLSWKDINCDGDMCFTIICTDMDKLKTLEVAEIIILNTHTHKSTITTINNPRYFIQLFWAIDNIN